MKIFSHTRKTDISKVFGLRIWIIHLFISQCYFFIINNDINILRCHLDFLITFKNRDYCSVHNYQSIIIYLFFFFLLVFHFLKLDFSNLYSIFCFGFQIFIFRYYNFMFKNDIINDTSSHGMESH